VESNIVHAIVFEPDSQYNTMLNPWVEGTNKVSVVVDGVSNDVANLVPPHKLVSVGPNSRVRTRTGTSVPTDAFFGYSANVVQNAEFLNGVAGWVGVPSGAVLLSTQFRLMGCNTIEMRTARLPILQVGYDITDAKFIEKATGKVVTMLMVGRKAPGTYASVRVMYDNSGSWSQAGTGEEFSTSAASVSRVTFIAPIGTSRLQLRIFGTKNPEDATIAHGTLPMCFIGQDINDLESRVLRDSGAHLFGPLIQAAPVVVPDGNATPDISAGNWFRLVNAGQTLITNLLNGRAGQEIKLQATNHNTTVASNAHIVTATGAHTPLVPNAFYRFSFDGARWYEG
jgi:hypothetical protein